MPLQNRVDPWGALRAVVERGALMGNRGIPHDREGHIVAPWRHKAWVTCRLEFKGRHRQVFSPHRYSELFFLDEATAFAAGHRPCAECNRGRFDEFKRVWCAANLPGIDARLVRVREIDARLHAERALRGGRKVTWRAQLGSLPDGSFVELDGAAWLKWQGCLYQWSFAGHAAQSTGLPAASQEVVVLTPRSVVEAYRFGFVPHVAFGAGVS